MVDSSGFRVRLRVRIAKGFTTEATRLNVVVASKDVAVTSQKKDEPLSKAKWIILSARGFQTEEDARLFGTRLSSIVELAGLAARHGVDVGNDQATSWVNEEFARATGLLKPHERIAPNVHGLAIVPDDDNTRFPLIEAEGTVTADPKQFESALTELGATEFARLGTTSAAVRALNLALMTSEPVAQMVLALSAVEALGQNEHWSESQAELIGQLASRAEAATGMSAEARTEVAAAIQRGLFRVSLRQGVMRLLTRLDLGHLRSDWDRLYGIRSGHFHGTARASDSEISQAAADSVTLCGEIILAIVASEGIIVPTIAATHFKSGQLRDQGIKNL